MDNIISKQDRSILIELAKKQLEMSQLPIMQQKIKNWKALNNFQMKQPMILLEMDTFEQEVLPLRMRCEGLAARSIETKLLKNMLPHELFNDDFVVPEYYSLNWHINFDLFGFKEKRIFAEAEKEQSVGHRFEHIIEDLEKDFEKFKKSDWGVDREATKKETDILSDLFEGILPIRKTMNCLYSVPTQKIVHMMGMENMLISIMDYPDLFKEMMSRIVKDTIEFYDWLEKEKLLLPTTDCQRLGQGTYCYTKELPEEIANKRFTTQDVWGFMDSQETVGISPEMYGEFIFPYYKEISARYGLLSYGCCEPVHPIWEKWLSKLSNLRKISISPWCDQVYMGEQLQGCNIVFQRKPSPNYLGVGEIMDESAVKKHIFETISAAKGCTLEFTQRDVYTIDNNPLKAHRYVELIRECIEEKWTPV